MSCCHGRLDFLHHLQRLLLGLRAEIFLHVDLAQRLSQIVIDILRAALPSRLQFLLSAQSLSIESEILIHECRRKKRSIGMDQVPAQINFPVRQIFFFDFLIQRLEESGGSNVQRAERR